MGAPPEKYSTERGRVSDGIDGTGRSAFSSMLSNTQPAERLKSLDLDSDSSSHQDEACNKSTPKASAKASGQQLSRKDSWEISPLQMTIEPKAAPASGLSASQSVTQLPRSMYSGLSASKSMTHMPRDPAPLLSSDDEDD